jgi:hypothetical protein
MIILFLILKKLPYNKNAELIHIGHLTPALIRIKRRVLVKMDANLLLIH